MLLPPQTLSLANREKRKKEIPPDPREKNAIHHSHRDGSCPDRMLLNGEKREEDPKKRTEKPKDKTGIIARKAINSSDFGSQK